MGLIIKGIYTIKNIENGNVYIGETLDIVRRWTEHLQNLQNGLHSNKSLQRDFDAHGKKAFEFNVEIFVDESINYSQTYLKLLLLVLERKTIEKYKEEGCKLYNKEDSLYKVLSDNKSIYDNTKVLNRKIIMSTVVEINRKLKFDLCRIGNVLYANIYKLKNLYSKEQLINANILQKVKGNSYRLNSEIIDADDIVDGNTYSTYKINNSARSTIDKLITSSVEIID